MRIKLPQDYSKDELEKSLNGVFYNINQELQNSKKVAVTESDKNENMEELRIYIRRYQDGTKKLILRDEGEFYELVLNKIS